MKCVSLLQCFKLWAIAFSGAFGKNAKHAIAAAIEALRHIAFSQKKMQIIAKKK
jgi:hypothetical protein